MHVVNRGANKHSKSISLTPISLVLLESNLGRANTTMPLTMIKNLKQYLTVQHNTNPWDVF